LLIPRQASFIWLAVLCRPNILCIAIYLCTKFAGQLIWWNALDVNARQTPWLRLLCNAQCVTVRRGKQSFQPLKLENAKFDVPLKVAMTGLNQRGQNAMKMTTFASSEMSQLIKGAQLAQPAGIC
jgi:hypothetical protein